MASEDEEALIAYQSSHRARTEAALLKAEFIASFIADGPGRALFVGLYQIDSSEVVPWERWLENPRIRELVDDGSDMGKDRDNVIWFHQQRTTFCDHWKGRLVVNWPPPERSWYRWADRNRFEIRVIHEDDELIERLDAWDRLTFNWLELSGLPRRFAQALQGWRGIYLIRDTTDGRGYVGSAYGTDNILGRWRNYAASGHGDNVLLRRRDPKTFVFSVLERLADNLSPSDVIEREVSWKIRLGTRAPDGLNMN